MQAFQPGIGIAVSSAAASNLTGEETMRKLIAVILAVAAVLGASTAFGDSNYAEGFKKNADGSVVWPFAL